MHEQTGYSPIRRRASLPAEQTKAYRRSIGTNAGMHPVDVPYTTGDELLDELDDPTPPRPSSSAVRYAPQVYTRGNQRIVIHREPPPAPAKKPTWVLFLCAGMLLMALGWLALTYVGNWWTNQENTWSYGFPRIYQTDVEAFKNDTPLNPTHVLALNLNGRVEIIIFPHGDGSHAKIYLGPSIYADNPSLVPVTVSFSDVDGSGKLAMIVHVGNQKIVYPNDGSEFQPPK